MSYIGQGLPADVFSGFTIDKFTGDGTANKALTLSKAPFSETTVLVTIDGVVQEPTDDFTVSGTTLTLVGTAANGSEINVTHLSGTVPSTLASKVDLNGVSDTLILDADADTTISADTDDQIDFKVGGTDEMTLSSTGLVINDGSNDRDFRVESNANANCLHVDGGNSSVGINTTGASDATLQINDTVALIKLLDTDDNTFSRMYHSAGNLLFDADKGNSGSGSYMQFGVDDTEVFKMSTTEIVANDASNDQDFRVEGNGDSHNLFVNAGTDHVGIGAGASPAYKLTVHDTVADALVQIKNTSSSGNIYGQHIAFGYAPDDNSNHFFYCSDGVANRMFIYSDGDIKNHDNSYGQVSDERIKQNIKDANSQWDDIKALKVRNFERKDDVAAYGEGKKVQIGLIAQECEAVSPGLVRETEPMAEDIKMSSEFGTLNEDGTIKTTTGEKVKGISYSVLYMKAIKALQEAMAKIETLETKVKALEDA